jgi:hypothetical protein
MHRPAVGGHEAEVKAAARAELKAQVLARHSGNPAFGFGQEASSDMAVGFAGASNIGGTGIKGGAARDL